MTFGCCVFQAQLALEGTDGMLSMLALPSCGTCRWIPPADVERKGCSIEPLKTKPIKNDRLFEGRLVYIYIYT